MATRPEDREALRSPQARALFAEAEIRAERTVAVVRVLVALALGGAFLAAVVNWSEGTTEPILLRQWMFAGATMAAYLLLGVGSFVATQRGVYKPWMAWGAVTGDGLFLLANLWTGLANTGLAGDYAIALPPLWLAPLVLAFGTLRYSPALQAYTLALLTAGIVAVFALSGGGSADVEGPLPGRLTLFFALPPNIMRLAMLVLAGVVLVIAAARARELLGRAIVESRRRANLTRYLPAEIADRLADEDIARLRQGRRQVAVVMFIDMRGFTALAETMAPDALSDFVTDFRVRISRIATAHGGVIDKFIGDAAMIVFGLIEPRETDAAAALACARELLADMARGGRGAALRVGVGVHRGEVFCGAIGDAGRLEYTVLGDTVNVASRLEDMTKEAGLPLIVSYDVLRAAGERSQPPDWRRLPDVRLRGRTAPLSVYGGDIINEGDTLG